MHHIHGLFSWRGTAVFFHLPHGSMQKLLDLPGKSASAQPSCSVLKLASPCWLCSLRKNARMAWSAAALTAQGCTTEGSRCEGAAVCRRGTSSTQRCDWCKQPVLMAGAAGQVQLPAGRHMRRASSMYTPGMRAQATASATALPCVLTVSGRADAQAAARHCTLWSTGSGLSVAASSAAFSSCKRGPSRLLA